MLTQFYWPVLHPFFFCTLAYIAGIFCAWVNFNALLLLAIIGGTIVAFALTPVRANWFIVFFILLGIFNFYVQQRQHKELTTRVCSHKATFFVTITDITQQNHAHNKYKISADIDYCTSHANVSQQLTIYVKNAPNCQVGDVIQLSDLGIKTVQKESLNNYFIKEGIIGTVFYQSMPYQLIYRPQYSIKRCFHQIREQLIGSLKQKMSLMTFSYFSCLFLGNKKVSKINDILKEYCQNWGILHYLARSGLHLVLFAFSIDILLALIPLTFHLKNICTLFLLLLYFLLTWNSTSFMRSILMVSLYKICFCFTRQIHVIHVLTLVTFYILWFNPIQLFFLDFQLSFGITLLLALFNQIQKQRRPSTI